MPDLTAGVVIATRNRSAALEMSLPLLLSQTRIPDQIIVVDSSDDEKPIEALIDQLNTTDTIKIELLRSAPGSSIQRNIGIKQIHTDICIFIDDDSLLFPTVIANIMRIYEIDVDCLVAGVSPGASSVSPLGFNKSIKETYLAKKHNSISKILADLYVYMENRVIRQPYVLLAEQLLQGKRLPENLRAAGCRLIADQEGFRMSFRTELIRDTPFNEHLTFYALGEDKDASYSLLGEFVIVETAEACVFHHEFPGHRHDGFRRGVVEILNQVYIVCRHSAPAAKARRAVYPYCALRGSQIALRCANRYQRQRLSGFLASLPKIRRLLEAPPTEIDQTYRDVMQEILEGSSG